MEEEARIFTDADALAAIKTYAKELGYEIVGTAKLSETKMIFDDYITKIFSIVISQVNVNWSIKKLN